MVEISDLAKERTVRTRITIRGTVQGVGFRPYLSRIARRLSLSGSVSNTVRGVSVEIEGPTDRVAAFQSELLESGPYSRLIESHEMVSCTPESGAGFEILPSNDGGVRSAWITPDLATCDECRVELFDPNDRRYRYPFNSCAVCGPRYSILEALPFDRENTSMRQFPLCPDCQREYTDPDDRRYHAQTISCPRCGPQLRLIDSSGSAFEIGLPALDRAVGALREGNIVALQGLGGFQLLVDATREDAVRSLRTRKNRPEKALALLFRDLEQIREQCEIDELEAGLIESPESPIVLVKRRESSALAVSIAPGNPNLGVMVPYTPLHHILMRAFARPLVATSGNSSGEPICISPEEARVRLGAIADLFLYHDRPIVRPVDDSVVRVIAGRSVCLRSARGFAPLTIPLTGEHRDTGLATGPQMKNSGAAAVRGQIVVSQHIGELDCPLGVAALRKWAEEIRDLYRFEPDLVAHDEHPDYASTRVADGLVEGHGTLHAVQHHHAHVASCMLEHGLEGPVLGLAWDGTGYGEDGTIWGGEFLVATPTAFERAGHFLTFPLPGGEAAVREPRRSALGLLYVCCGEAAFDGPAYEMFSEEERRVLRAMLVESVNTPLTSSVGRFFDAIASLLGIRQTVSFEGQAAMELEFLAATATRTGRDVYPFEITVDVCAPSEEATSRFGKRLVVDWRPMIPALLSDLDRCEAKSEIAARFQRTLVEIGAGVVEALPGLPVVLTGGCFQNRALTESLLQRLESAGRDVFLHSKIPPNDGGVSAGQILVAIERAAHVSGDSR